MADNHKERNIPGNESSEAARAAIDLHGSPVKPRLTLDEIRKTHPRAYERWTPEEEARLFQLLEEGHHVEELVELFGRQPGAITGRLACMGHWATDTLAPPGSVSPAHVLDGLRSAVTEIAKTLAGKDARSVQISLTNAVQEALLRFGLEPTHNYQSYGEKEGYFVYAKVAGIIEGKVAAVVEIDRVNRHNSFVRLLKASASGIAAFWVRWGLASSLPSVKGFNVPPEVLLIECAIDYERTTRAADNSPTL